MYLKQGDLAPAITVDTNADVTGASSLKLQMRRFHTTTVIEKTMTVVDAPTGVLTYSWVGTDTNTPGTYALNVAVTFASGKTEHFPQRSSLELVILP